MRQLTNIFILLCCFIACRCCSSAYTGTGAGKIAPRIYKAEYNDVFANALEAANLKGWQIIFTDKDTGVISAKVSTRLWTWGNDVSIRVHKIANENVQVDLSSGSHWGKNARNIRAYYEQLDTLINAL